MNRKEMELLRTEELKEIAKEKAKNGNASRSAKTAQKILYERNDRPFNNDIHKHTYGSKRFDSADNMSKYKVDDFDW